MTEQATLLEAPPPTDPAEKELTEKQQFILDQVTAAGPDGLHTDECGALWCERRGKHSAQDRCEWDGKAWSVLVALRKRGLVKYRGKLKDWIAFDTPVTAADEFQHAETGGVPYNEFPPGF